MITSEGWMNRKTSPECLIFRGVFFIDLKSVEEFYGLRQLEWKCSLERQEAQKNEKEKEYSHNEMEIECKLSWNILEIYKNDVILVIWIAIYMLFFLRFFWDWEERTEFVWLHYIVI